MSVYLAYSGMDAISKHLAGTVEAPVILWSRYAVMVSLLLVWKPRELPTLGPLLRNRTVLLRSVFPAGSGIFAIISVAYLPLFDATALFFTSPLMTVVMAAWLLKERLTRQHIIATVLGFAGILLIARPGSALFGWVILLPLACAIMFGAFQISTRLVRDLPPYKLLWCVALTGGLLSSLALPFTSRLPDAAALGWLTLGGALFAFGQVMLLWGLQRAEAGRLAPLGYLQAVFALVLGMVVFGERPDWPSLGGMGIIILASLWSQRR